jgi:hypothetical protein
MRVGERFSGEVVKGFPYGMFCRFPDGFANRSPEGLAGGLTR